MLILRLVMIFNIPTIVRYETTTIAILLNTYLPSKVENQWTLLEFLYNHKEDTIEKIKQRRTTKY